MQRVNWSIGSVTMTANNRLRVIRLVEQDVLANIESNTPCTQQSDIPSLVKQHHRIKRGVWNHDYGIMLQLLLICRRS